MAQPGLQFLNPADARWIEFAQAQPEANIFHHPAWMEVLAACYGYRGFIAALCDGQGGIQAGLPVMEINSRLTGRRWVSMPFSDHCAPLSTGAEALLALKDGLGELARQPRTPRIELRSSLFNASLAPPSALFALHTMPLQPDPAAVERNVHPMHLRNIRTARKNEVRTVRTTGPDGLEQFYRLHLNTRRKQGMPVQPLRFFRLLQAKIIERGLGYVLLARANDACIAGAVFLHWGQTLTYKYGASDQARLSLRPNNLIFWEAIAWGCANGYKMLDLGKTDLENEGLRQFKERWGAEESVLRYTTLAQNPAPSAESFFGGVLKAVIRNTPPVVCRITGELLYKHYG